LLDNEGFLSPSTLLSVFEHHEHVLTNAYQYKNVKADVRSFLSTVKNWLICFMQYLSAIWNVINFDEANSRYTEVA